MTLSFRQYAYIHMYVRMYKHAFVSPRATLLYIVYALNYSEDGEATKQTFGDNIYETITRPSHLHS